MTSITIAEICILVAALLPYATVTYAKIAAGKSFNNGDPRKEGGYSGESKRAYDAHLNGFEIFPFFAISVLLSEFYQAPQGYITALALTFIALRVAYIVAYIGNAPVIRSAFFTLGLLATIVLFLLPVIA